MIRPGVSIAKFRLGMTEQQVRRAAGRPTAVVRHPRAAFAQRTVELQYGLGAGYVVQLAGPLGRMRVNFVSTTLRRERTSNGIGTGSLERVLRERYPALRCGPLNAAQPPGTPGDRTPYVDNRRDCTLFSGRGSRTIFRSQVTGKRYGVTAEEFLRRAEVVEIAVSLRPCRRWNASC